MNIAITIIISFLFGLVPEVTYFTLFLIYTKQIKEKKLLLWILIAIAYVLCMFVQKYKAVYYILFIVLVYLILKLLYKKKTQIIDIFVFSLSFSYICFIGFLFSRFLVDSNPSLTYFFSAFMNRIFLFIPFIFKNKFNFIYKKYCKLWNRDYNKKQPIKSITLRNSSLILLNIFIFIINIIAISMTALVK